MTNATIEPAPSAPPPAVAAMPAGPALVAPVVPASAAGDVVAVAATLEGSQAVVDAQFRALRAGAADRAPLDLDTELGERLGAQFAFVRAALPDAVRARFNAQLAARASLRGSGTSPGVGPQRSAADLRALVLAASSAGDEDTHAQAALATLARYVADHGPRPVAEALRYEQASVFGGAPNAPVRPAERRDERRDDRQKERRQPERAALEAEPAAPAPVNAPYTLDDVVERGGDTIARHRHDMRNLTWPSYSP